MGTMKIAVITEHYPPVIGGVAHSSARLARGLFNSGLNVAVITFDRVSKHTTTYIKTQPDCKCGFPVYRIGPFPAKPSSTKAGQLAMYKRDFVHSATNICLNEEFDILHAIYINDAGYLTSFVANQLEVPLVLSVRGNDISRDIYDPARFAAIQWTVENSQCIVFVSSNLRDIAARLFAIGPKSRVINNCIDFSVYERHVFSEKEKLTLRSKYNIPTEKTVIGFVGLIRNKKGVVDLLHACEILLEEEVPIHLLLVGDLAKEYDREYYKDLLNNSSLASSTTITGLVPPTTIKDYLSAIDILVQPSRDDGLPNSLLEAMAMGKAIIASDLFEPILDNESHALIVRRGDSIGIANAVKRLLSDENLRQELGIGARQLTKTRFDIHIEIEQYTALYHELLKQPEVPYEPRGTGMIL